MYRYCTISTFPILYIFFPILAILNFPAIAVVLQNSTKCQNIVKIFAFQGRVQIWYFTQIKSNGRPTPLRGSLNTKLLRQYNRDFRTVGNKVGTADNGETGPSNRLAPDH